MSADKSQKQKSTIAHKHTVNIKRQLKAFKRQKLCNFCIRDLPFISREKCLLSYNVPFDFKENYPQMVKMPLPSEEFASKSKRQIPHTKITKFLPFQCL